jgi:mannose-1-phosphate guanylyltransferase
MSGHDRLWAIVLAAGQGARLAPLTERLYDEPLPKQFAVLAGERSLLQTTIDRLLPLVPASRTVVVVPLAYEELARQQLAEHRGIRVVAQPANRGTGPGILLPLAHVLEADPRARVVVTPSDHHVADARALTRAISVAAAVTSAPLTLVGVEADRPETEYGWIDPGDVLPGNVRRVERFVEKPDPEQARALLERGALWNTFVFAAGGRRLWSLTEEKLPVQAALIHSCVSQQGPQGSCLARAYAQMQEANFSRAVLERTPGLAVVAAPRCGFSDWGSPERVFESLRGTNDLDRLLARLGQDRSSHDGAWRQEGTRS